MTTDRPGTLRAGRLAVAGIASLGAGAIHAAAIGVHRDHTPAVVAFTVVALFQLGWGAIALTSSTRAVAVFGAVGNGGALAGWILAKVSGIWFVDGLDQAENVQLADGLAAALAAIALFGALSRVYRRTPRRPIAPRPLVLGGVAIVVAALTIPGMASAGNHEHGASGHTHTAASPSDSAHTHGGAAHASAAVAPKPYDPTQPIDLSGVPGVSPEQQARAENLIAITLQRLPKFADTATAEANGFHSIGDGFTGEEHYVNWSYLNDDKILDPDYPESLVYHVEGRTKTLVAAMFMLSENYTLDTVPDVGGKLTQWHVHNDLCFTPDPIAPRLAGGTSIDGPCRAPNVKKGATPMIHVWIVPHRCGPFAALDGVGGGQIKAGESRLCDHAHGA